MEILTWLLWALMWLASVLWSLVWFLISGWVSTLLQILIVVGVVYVLKFGWRRAPFEMARHGKTSGRMFWNWLRAKEAVSDAGEAKVVESIRVVRAKDFGDINMSTLMTLTMIGGVVWLSLL